MTSDEYDQEPYVEPAEYRVLVWGFLLMAGWGFVGAVTIAGLRTIGRILGR